MPADTFAHVRTWVFDLDNTLYPPEVNLFRQMEALMNRFISTHLGIDGDAAAVLRRTYWQDHGTTLAGLMIHHDIDADAYLDAVHQLDLSNLTPDPALRSGIAALPGRKIVYTNGTRGHARQVTRARGIEDLFDAMYGVEDAGYIPKPRAEAFARVFALDDLEPEIGAMFEDDVRNLAVPHELGMRTVLVHADNPQPHVHYRTHDLAGFLSRVL
ncbi:MAG: pyrimidine 5'-nucleotidase [Pseudomonadota bacterium]